MTRPISRERDTSGNAANDRAPSSSFKFAASAGHSASAAVSPMTNARCSPISLVRIAAGSTATGKVSPACGDVAPPCWARIWIEPAVSSYCSRIVTAVGGRTARMPARNCVATSVALNGPESPADSWPTTASSSRPRSACARAASSRSANRHATPPAVTLSASTRRRISNRSARDWVTDTVAYTAKA